MSILCRNALLILFYTTTLGSHAFADVDGLTVLDCSATPTFPEADADVKKYGVLDATYDLLKSCGKTCSKTVDFASTLWNDRKISEVLKSGSSVCYDFVNCGYYSGLLSGCVARDVTGMVETMLDQFVRDNPLDLANRSRADKFSETCTSFSEITTSASLFCDAFSGLLSDCNRENLHSLVTATGYIGYTTARTSLCLTCDGLSGMHDLIDFAVSGELRRSTSEITSNIKTALSDPVAITRATVSSLCNAASYLKSKIA